MIKKPTVIANAVKQSVSYYSLPSQGCHVIRPRKDPLIWFILYPIISNSTAISLLAYRSIIFQSITKNSFPFFKEGGFDFSQKIKDGRVINLQSKIINPRPLPQLPTRQSPTSPNLNAHHGQQQDTQEHPKQ